MLGFIELEVIVKTASHQMLQKIEWRQLALEVLLHFVEEAVEAGIDNFAFAFL